MEPKLVNLEDFVYSGEGANGASYNDLRDRDRMLKLYYPSMDRELIELEVKRSQDVYDAGIPSPRPGDFVTDGNGRYGILFRRLAGKISYARAVGNEPDRVEELARDFARLGRRFHSTVVDTSLFPSVKDQYRKMLDDNPYCTPEEKAKLLRIIDSTPDAETAIHGDFHFGNALIVGDDRFYIDLGEFAYGNPLFDLGMITIVCRLNDEAFTQENFHMDNATANRFFDYFIDEYFEGKYTVAQAEQLLFPYAAVKGLLVERNGNFRFNVIHEILEKIV